MSSSRAMVSAFVQRGGGFPHCPDLKSFFLSFFRGTPLIHLKVAKSPKKHLGKYTP